jgi:hypothetical protein
MTSYWGPRYWYVLHSTLMLYPENPNIISKQIYTKFIELFVKLIPCPNCQKHFVELILKFPVNFNSKQDLEKWAFDIHNTVNKRLSKPKMDMDSYKIKYANINHEYIYDFIMYNKKRAYINHIPYNYLTSLLEILVLTYPCMKCRKLYRQEYLKSKIPSLYVSKIDLHRWIHTYFKIEGKHPKQSKPQHIVTKIDNTVKTSTEISPDVEHKNEQILHVL